VEKEKQEREDVATKFLDAIRSQLPRLLASLDKIKDFRNPKKIKHQLDLVLFYGILCFALQMASRREANRELTGPVLREHLQQLFPQLESLPHQDTVNRILSDIDVQTIEDSHLEMIRRLVRNKKFARWLIDGRYPLGVDGTQKAVRRDQVSEQWLQRRLNADTDKETTQYYVYVLEACLCFSNGLRLPLMSEFLNYAEGDVDNGKQDCETKAFKRLAARLKTEFPKLPILLLLDGLYPNGPMFQICRDHNWQFMIVLQDKSLPSVWEEYYALRKLEPNQRFQRTWGNRKQSFQWANRIEYRYGPNSRHKQVLHVVVCEETWREVDEDGDIVDKKSRHAWISSEPLTADNLHERCNLAARNRWGIESNILVEKRQGYQYEHLFSHNWSAMRGYHYLMHIAHALCALATHSEMLAKLVASKGIRPTILFIRQTLTAPWVEPKNLLARLHPNPQLRLA